MPTATKLSTEQMLETIKNMTMVEINELVKAIEEEFGVTAAMPTMVAAAPAAGGGEAAAEKTDFSVILVNAGGNKIPVIKEVRTITGLGLKEAKDLVEAGGKSVKDNVPKEEAMKIKDLLEKAGATVELK